MASGTWSETDKPTRPGFYMNFKAAAKATLESGSKGIVAIPVKANWGPIKQICEITPDNLADTYGEDVVNPYTAYKCLNLALLGKPQKALGYRLADSSAAKGSLTLKDGATTSVLTMTTKYESSRAFNATVRDNPVDSANYQDIVLFEGTTQLYAFTFAKGASVVDNAVAAINNDASNEWIAAAKVVAGNGTLAAVANQAFTGGNDGTAAITNADYVTAMTAFEAQDFNSFALDGATDESLQTSAAAWIARIRSEGKKVVAYTGGSAENDQVVSTANTHSTGFNSEGVVNVGVSGILDGVTYSSAEVACYVAGLAVGQTLKESLTYAITPFDDVSPRLTSSEVKAALKAGTLVMVSYNGEVVIEQGINTLTTLADDQNDGWSKIKIIRLMDAIADDTSKAAHTSYIGKVPNNADGQAALLSAIKAYFETLAPDLIDDDFTVEADTALQASAKANEFYWKYSATAIDNMEKIFGTGYITY